MAWTTPKTWTVGEVLTAAALNTHLRDNLLSLRKLAIASASGINTSIFTYYIVTASGIDDFGSSWPGGGYFNCPEDGRYEVTVNTTWTGASGTGAFLTQADHWAIATSSITETICSDYRDYVNGRASMAGIVTALRNDRIYFGSANSATGTAGTLAHRITVIQRG